ncbi:MAG TPA: prolipoprotein diacylglyceryl transferase [Azospirillum sp.]|nr:prolipoprotein diacylglyceryl transferase [Azospirillum sp.]
MLAIPFPAIDPVAVSIGPIAIRWYALAYLVGFILGWRYCLALAKRHPGRPSPEDYDDFLTWAVLGVILGGRVGYVLFYNLPYYLENPLEALAVWHGGMAFHGGALGVVAAILLFCWRRGLSPFAFADLICAAVPIGLFFGRIANFINGELYGRAAPDVPWAVVFPRDPLQVPRHPSQLYEAMLEGLVLFVVLAVAIRNPAVRSRPGMASGIFLVGYGLSRIIVEFFREPDAQLGFLWGGATMGQLLSLPMVLIGLWLMMRARRAVTA